LIRTAEQLKIKGLCEINDHTNAAESDNEVIYPPHKKIRASRNYDNNNSLNSNKNLAREDLKASSDKDAQASVASNEEHNSKHKSKSPSKETKSASSQSNISKNMASLEMGMVSYDDALNSLLLTLKPLELSEWQRRYGRSACIHGLRAGTTSADSDARHHNGNELQSKSRYKRFIT
jgi:hypothetical protein